MGGNGGRTEATRRDSLTKRADIIAKSWRTETHFSDPGSFKWGPRHESLLEQRVESGNANNDRRWLEQGAVIRHVNLPLRGPNGVVYMPTWDDPIALVRLNYSDETIQAIRTAARIGRASLSIKSYEYPAFPILQFVVSFRQASSTKPFFFSETMGDISDADFQGFFTDVLKRGRWRLVAARNDAPVKPDVEIRTLVFGLDDTGRREQSGWVVEPTGESIEISGDWSRSVIAEIQKSVKHFLSVPSTKRDFGRAMRQFQSDDLRSRV